MKKPLGRLLFGYGSFRPASPAGRDFSASPRNDIKLFLLLVLFLALVSSAGAVSLGSPSETLKIGKAKVEITPPVGTPLAGYGKLRKKHSVGVHDPLYARALALTNGSETFVTVSVDLVLIDAKLRSEVLKKINEKKTLGPDQFILLATHTHSGTGAIGGRFWQRFIMGKFRKSVFKMTTDKIAQAALEALDALQPVQAELAETRINGMIENRMDERLNYPDSLRVLRFKDAEGKILAWTVFMAAHPTLFPASGLLHSADFPGVINHELEGFAPDSVSLLINGAAGDLRPKTGEFEDRKERTKAYGLAAAEKIKSLSFKEIQLGEGPWASFLEMKKLPRVQVRLGKVRIPAVFGGRVFPRHSTFQALRMGQYLFLAFPAELSVEVGRGIEQEARARGFIPFILGYANDYIGYVVPRYYYHDRSQYESRASFYGPKLDWFIQRRAIHLTERLLTEDEKKDVLRPGKLIRRPLRSNGNSPSPFPLPLQGGEDKGEGVDYKNTLPVLKLYGPSYHTGFEEGRLLKREIRKGIRGVLKYFEKELPIPFFNLMLINTALDRAWRKMEPYISYSEYLQIKGLADGTGLSFRKMKRIHAIPEVYPTWCSNGAYWGKATRDGRLIALRNLDWNRKIGIHRHAVVKYIKTPGRLAYVNIGYYGFAGVLSGINEEGISVGQVGAESKEETMKGVPMPFLLKRILEESHSLEDAKAIFKRSFLTRGYNYVIADALEKQAIAVEATARHLAFFEDQDPKEKDVGYAVLLENAVFRADPALDPAIRNLQFASKGNPKKPGFEMPAGSAYEIRYKKHGELIRKNYGRIDPEFAKKTALEIAPGSNIQSVIYAFPDFWVANATGGLRAAETEYVHFNFEEFIS